MEQERKMGPPITDRVRAWRARSRAWFTTLLDARLSADDETEDRARRVLRDELDITVSLGPIEHIQGTRRL